MVASLTCSMMPVWSAPLFYVTGVTVTGSGHGVMASSDDISVFYGAM